MQRGRWGLALSRALPQVHDAQQWAPRDCMSSHPTSACDLASTWPKTGCPPAAAVFKSLCGTFFISLAQVICPTITLSASLTLSLSFFRSVFFVICICSAYLRLHFSTFCIWLSVFCLFSWCR